jgi:hypothetical protein
MCRKSKIRNLNPLARQPETPTEKGKSFVFCRIVFGLSRVEIKNGDSKKFDTNPKK